MWEYTDKVQEHFLNPRNVGEIENASAIGEVGSLACGDALKLYLAIDTNDVITDAKFQTFGCASAIASSSALTEIVKGMKVDDALKITNVEIAEFLGGLPPEKMHCSVMGAEALEAAVRSYKGLAPIVHEDDHSALICKCFGITEKKIKDAIALNKLTTLDDIINITKAGSACGKCKGQIEDILEEELGTKACPAQAPTNTASPMTNIQRMQKVLAVIDVDIRPRLAQDGGDIELIDISGANVTVALRGACSTCRSAKVTLKNFVEKTLQEQVDPSITVVEG